MKISVIVPVYDTSAYLDRCITALMEQDYPAEDYEVIAVDNGSTDGSADRLLAYPRLRVLTETRRGSYAARNTGVRAASGRILAFTDSDCAPGPGWLRCVDEALSHPDAAVVLGQRRLVSRSALLSALNVYEITKDEFTFSGHDPLKYYGFTNNMAVRRAVYDRFGPFVERDRGADTIFVRRVVDGMSCEAVVFEPEMVVRHLELRTLRDYLRKMFIYGRSRKRYQHVMPTRPLAFRDRLGILTAVLRRERFSPLRAAALAGALACTTLAWQLGSWAGAVSAWRERRR